MQDNVVERSHRLLTIQSDEIKKINGQKTEVRRANYFFGGRCRGLIKEFDLADDVSQIREHRGKPLVDRGFSFRARSGVRKSCRIEPAFKVNSHPMCQRHAAAWCWHD